MNLPGKNFLKVTGILYLIFSGIDIFFLLVGMDDASLGSQLEEIAGASTPLLLFNDLFGLFIGIMGIAYCNSREKAKILIGIVIAAFIWDGFFLIILSKWSNLIGLPLPILYLIGAVKNKNSA